MIKFKLDQLIVTEEKRLNRKLPLSEIARECGVTRVTLSRMINQVGYSCGFDTADKLCRYFNCDLCDLAEYIDDG